MVEWLKFIEELELLHKMLTVEKPEDDCPNKIFTRGKIREFLAVYKKQMEEFESYAMAMEEIQEKLEAQQLSLFNSPEGVR